MTKTSLSIFALAVLLSFSGCATTTAPEPIFTKVLTECPKIISATPMQTGAGGFWDMVNDKAVQKRVTVIDKAKVKLAGWACDVEKGTVPQDAYLEFEGPTRAYFKITTRTKRSDVVAYFKKSGITNSGWEAYVDLTGLPSGTYKVKIIQIEGKVGLSDETGRSFELLGCNLKPKK